MANLETTYLGLKLKNPIVAASSGLTNSVDKIKELADNGVGAIVLKSIFEEQINNEISNILYNQHYTSYPEAEDYIKVYTRDNTLQHYLQLVKDAKAAVDVPIIASINCVSATEWVTFAKDLVEAGADALELNVFVVPTEANEKSDELEMTYINVLNEVKKHVNVPVAIKIGFYFTNIVAMADKLYANGANGVVMFNRFYEPDIDVENLEITSSEVFSSPTDIRRSLRWTGMISSAVPNIDIAASTGIHDGNGVLKQLLAGAQVVQLCSTLYKNGAPVVKEILTDLENFMGKWDYTSLADFRGKLSYGRIKNPAMYERAQFMKYFSNKK
ncbi:dihydroorotate dehydrogenase-like protein [Prolixibacteraceae bacterium JC049]|nr:dihydroorotate dehydrogenase-like protein [Prolixibacteraceae bacterium JC049]